MRKLTKKQDALLREAAGVLRKSNNPDLKFIAKHLKGGFDVVNYLFAAGAAARKKVPTQYEVQPVTLTSTNKKTTGNILAAQWLIDIVTEHVAHAQEV